MNRNESKKKWAFFVPETIPSFAGSGINAFNFARYLNKNSYKVKIITLNRNLKLNSEDIIENVIILRLPYVAINNLTKVFSLLFIIPRYLYQILKNEVIFIYGSHLICYQLIIILSNIFNKKIIFRSTVYSEDDISSLVTKRYIGGFNKYIINKINLYFSLTPAFTESFLKIYPDKLKILETPQGVNEIYFYPATTEQKKMLRKKLNLYTNKPVIISAGFLINRKGYEEIFIQLSKINYEFLYIVMGNYKESPGHFQTRKEIIEMEYLYKLGKDLLQNKIEFIGSKLNIYDYLRSSDIFLHNAHKEGLPNVLLEAMACGLPVLTRKLNSLSGYLISHMNNAIEFEKPEEIPLYINSCINNTLLCQKLAKNAHNTILKSFTFHKTSERLINKLQSNK